MISAEMEAEIRRIIDEVLRERAREAIAARTQTSANATFRSSL